ncbi:urease accessory protein UreF [Chelativorans sp. AA-79]|uniref:urease accessory protein UreF n=1 Tax=Chelativorans sp. AA-79 TaxID=3028735 RepID=UPI0023F7C9AE|nr:urease accessory protein UreF [Chelativorans sp. AA-79]WEX10255.1 urease accessory protein UreF [Chelativorans sp. AA-79]
MGDLVRLLQLVQFSDSALPVGAFTFSNGLESAIQEGVVHDAGSLKAFVLAATRQAATLDGVALLVAHRAAQAEDMGLIVAADHAAHQRKLNEETRTMAVRMGRKLGELGEHIVRTRPLADWMEMVRGRQAPGTFPIGLALVTSGFDIDARHAFAAHQYGVASMILGAALRLMRITFLETQAILFEVNATVEEAYEHIRTDTLDDMKGFAPAADILAAVHLKAHIRMFMN